MLKEALQFLTTQAQAAQAVQKLDQPRDRRSVRYRVGDEIRDLPEDPPPRRHEVGSLDDLIRFALDHAVEGTTQAIWHQAVGVMLVLDDAERLDLCAFRLSWSPAFAALLDLDCDPPRCYSQRDFIRLLDVTLGVDPAIVARFRKLDWSTMIAAQGEIAKGRDRMGKEVNSSVAGTDDLPDDLMLHVPVYREPGERETHAVRCRIETWPQNSTLSLIPLAGECDLAIEWAQGSIRERLVATFDDDSVRIYHGKPFGGPDE